MPFTPVSERVKKIVSAELAGVRVILTRPQHQCQALIAMLEARGADARCLPVIEIELAADPAPAMEALENLARFDLAVFTSANAVRAALSLKPDLASTAATPAVAAVGPATGRALREAGIPVAITPANEFSSEGLLRHPGLKASAVRGQRVLIVKGEGGRGLLAEALTSAGALVAPVNVYRRSRPEVRISQLLGEPPGEFDLIVLTSGTAVEHLLAMASAEERQQILGMTMVVSSERIARIAREHGARRRPIVAAGPGDDALVEAVRSSRENRS